MICDSQQGFEFSWLNSLLSWAFSRQDKKIKINGIINGSLTFIWYESYNTENYVGLCSIFFYWFRPVETRGVGAAGPQTFANVYIFLVDNDNEKKK